MPEIIISKAVDGGAFTDFKDRKIIHLGSDAPPIKIALLKRGMASGKSSVGIGFELSPEEVVIVEISLELFLAAADALRALDKS